MDNQELQKKKNETKEKNRIARQECLDGAMTARGWDEETAAKHLDENRKRLGIKYKDYKAWELWNYDGDALDVYYQKKVDVREKNRKERLKCLECAMEATGWDEETAIKHLDENRKRLGIKYKEYRLWKLWNFDGEELELQYQRKLEIKAKNEAARQACLDTVMEATGWDLEKAKEHIDTTRKHYGIKYEKYLKWKMYRFDFERQSVNPMLSKKAICELLEIAFDGNDECYTAVTIAKRTVPGSLSVVQFNRQPNAIMDEAQMIKAADEAISKGAKCLLATQQIREYPCLVVPGHVVDSAKKIVRYLRKEKNLKAIEVTGSYGKTTVSSMVEAVFESKYRTFGHRGKNNNTFSQAVDRVQDIPEDTEIFIQEATEAPNFKVPGHVSEMVIPNLGIVTSIGTSHMEQMGSAERILESCISIQDGMEKEGVLLLNGDDPMLSKVESEHEIIYYGVQNESVDYRAVNIHQRGAQVVCEIEHNGTSTPVVLNCFGLHNAQNAAAAFAAGKILGMTDAEVAAGLAGYRPTGIRQRLVCDENFNLYIDCYNASMESMCSSLDTLCNFEIPEGGRRIAVLADILESGDHSEEYHRVVGKHVRDSKVDVLICLGEAAQYIYEEASQRENLETYMAKNHKEIIMLLTKMATKSDYILFKGSHGMELICIPEVLLRQELE